MAFKTDKPYTYNKSRRLAMIHEAIKKLIPIIPQNKRQTPELETFEESVKPPELTIFTINITKLENDSPLTT